MPFFSYPGMSAFLAWRFHFDVVRALIDRFRLGVRIPNFMIPRFSTTVLFEHCQPCYSRVLPAVEDDIVIKAEQALRIIHDFGIFFIVAKEQHISCVVAE